MSRKRSQISVIPADDDAPRHEAAILIQAVPLTTRAAFKAACAKRGETMRDVLIKLMRSYAAKVDGD